MTDGLEKVYGGSMLGGGLTKREYFAALAMQNIQNVFLRKSGEAKLESWKKEFEITTEQVIAQLAVTQADALIEALNND